MLSLKQKQSGFTIVELLIVIVIIGILAGLVITTFVGIQARGRDSERRTDLKAMQGQLEAYFADNGGYPTRDDFSDATWRTNNKVTLDVKAQSDPKGNGNGLGGTTTATQYSYVPGPGACNSPTTSANPPVAGTTPYCTTYTLQAASEANSGTNFTITNQ